MPNKTKQNTKNSTEQICSQPLYKSQTTHHTQPTPVNPAGCAGNHHPQSGGRQHGVEREPDSVPAHLKRLCPTQNAPTPTTHFRAVNTCRHKKTKHPPTHSGPMNACSPQTGLPRKEVIQPHLPVRLPCYDFVPIANPTFDHSPRTKRLGHGLRVLPTFVT